MTPQLDLIGALFIGLAGASHCFAMCGGVSAALSMAIPPAQQQFGRNLAYLLCYNLGRLLSYTLAGAIVGALVASSGDIAHSKHLLQVLRSLAAVLMIALGLYLMGWWHGILYIERLGAKIWSKIQPLAARLLPLRTPWHALPFGMVWGWLPCGLVYSMLTWSAASGSGQGGALIMLCFGLGTLPTLFALGGLADRLRYWLTRPFLRKLAALFLIGYGLIILNNAAALF